MGKIIRRKEKFDIAISFGGCCQTVYQLKKNNLRTEAYPFDWITTTIPTIHNLLATDFKNWLNKTSFQCILNEYALDTIYGCKFLHDFKYNNKETFMEDYEEHYQKYQRRIDRLRKLMEGSQKVLFVRRKGEQKQAEDLEKLIKKQYSNLNFKLAVLNEDPWQGGYKLLQKEPWHWKGDDNQWRLFFNQFCFS